MDRYRVVLGCSALVGLALGYLSLTLYSQCYIDPCEEGHGLDSLFTVDFSRSFDTLTAASIMIGHAVWGWHMMRDSDDRPSNASVGFMLGTTCMLLVMSIQSAVRWGYESYLMDNLATHRDFKESGRLSHVVPSELPEFSIMCALSVLEGLLMLVLLKTILDTVTSSYGLRPGYERDDFGQARSLLDPNHGIGMR